jgi:maltose phosphorylase
MRFCSMSDHEVGAIRYTVTLDKPGKLQVVSYLDGAVRNEDSNWEETFWEKLSVQGNREFGSVVSMTKKTGFVAAASHFSTLNSTLCDRNEISDFSCSSEWIVDADPNKSYTIEKYLGIVSSLDYPKEQILKASVEAANRATTKGFDGLLEQHIQAWDAIWDRADIVIEGDIEAQQGIRFNIFHLNQTYTGKDARLNIGPKGFTGEKYGGSTYWDTEAYCLPFYLNTHTSEVAKQLLVYRYNQLPQAIKNAEKLGFTNGAALFPMVTMNGEECHNEWEITFEEIHRNGAIAFGIYNYIRHTGDRNYMAEYGFDVLLGICRFWAQRVNWSAEKDAYVILGVTGPNEYENNVNNNWYTNYIARWCLTYGLKTVIYLQENHLETYHSKCKALHFKEESETKLWAEIIEKIYLPRKADSKVWLQQDGFLDKELIKVSDLASEDRPINQKWSWDRILRSPFIKQADVLQGLYFFEHHFDDQTIAENFDFYEPLTVHESSLSPCVHAILAAKLGRVEKAYELYLRTARLDLDDYNHEVYQGLHITSMAGTWMTVVEGFGGLRFRDGLLKLNPVIPDKWNSYVFRIFFRGRVLVVNVGKSGVDVRLEDGLPLEIELYGKRQLIEL